MQRLFYGGTNMYLGVDLGSTNIKAAIYDGSMQLVGQQSRPVEYLRENGFVEFDAERYYNELAALIAQLTRDCGVSVVRETDCVPSLVIRISSKDARAVAAG